MATALGLDGPAQNDDEAGDDIAAATTDEGKFLTLRAQYITDDGHCAAWHEQARKDFDFTIGKQWEDQTSKAMIDEKRPPITFNLCLSIIKAVAGIEINSRHEIYYYPRDSGEGDVIANELLNGCSRWMGQNCDAEDEQSEAFQDALKVGMGWTEHLMDYEEDPEGKYIESELDPLEMRWDRYARKKNLVDARRLWRCRKMSLADARALMESVGATDYDDGDLDASWAVSGGSSDGIADMAKRKNRVGSGESSQPDKDEVHIVHAQWYEREPYFRVANPFTGKIDEMGQEELDQIIAKAAEIGVPLQYVKQVRRVYKQAYLGGKMLWHGPGICKDKFSWQCLTGEQDKNAGLFFGLITVLRDPQMMANKWLSQATHIINTTAKGGIIAERGAFTDIREAQRTYARPDAITVVKDGAIAGGKIMAKPGPGMTAPYFQLMQYAVDSIWRVTGMNQEIMGMRDVNQPGILEQQRKQAALTILATMFDSLRRYRKNVGRVRLHFIQNFLSDGRIIRINGDSPGVMKGVRLLKDQTLGEYDVIVDDAPTSPNQKDKVFAMLQQLLPSIGKNLSSEAVMVFLEYSPLPREAVEKFRKILMAPPSPQDQMGQKIQIDGAVAKIEDMRAGTQQKLASAEKTRAEVAETQAQIGKTQAEAIVELAQLGVAASQEELNRIKGAVTIAKAVNGSGVPEEPDEPMVGYSHDGLKPPMPPPMPPVAPRVTAPIDQVPPVVLP